MNACTIRATLRPGAGWLIEGSCGERLMLGVSEVLLGEMIPSGSCPDFHARVLQAYGPGGPRRLTPEIEDATVDPRMLGPRGIGPMQMLGTALGHGQPEDAPVAPDGATLPPWMLPPGRRAPG